MTKSRPVTLIVAAGLLLLLILLSALLPLVGGDRLLFAAGRVGNTRNGQGFRQLPSGQQPSNNNSNNAQPYQGNGTGTGTYQGTRPYNGNFTGANSGFLAVTRILQRILEWVELGLGILAIVGLWLKKRWGVVLAIITSVLIFGFTITGVFRMFNSIVFIENLAKILLAVAVIVLTLLPQSRKATAPAQN